MSIEIMSTVWRLGLPTNRKFVLLKLADHANEHGRQVFPSVAHVAARCGLSKRTVQRILGEFVKEGALTVIKNEKGGAGGPRHYQIEIELLEHLYPAEIEAFEGDTVTPSENGGAKAEGDTVTPSETGAKGDTVTPSEAARVTPATPEGDTGDGQGCQSLSPESPLTITNHQGAPAADAAPGGASPANAQWKAKAVEIERAFGGDFESWIDALTPDSDDGEVLLLAAPSRMYVKVCSERFKTTLEHILERRIVIEVRSWASGAYKKRQAIRRESEEIEDALGEPAA